jgi:2-(1,2-epoxy-1,2-dihydrophenyl)acetyl-CoA isomerase
VDYTKIKLSMDGDVAILTMSDPATMNAASVTVAEEMTDVFRRIALGVLPARAVVLTGEGRGFCSGANLNSGAASTVDIDGKPDAGRGLELHYNPLVTLIRDCDVPIITAVNGAAAGVGCSLALLGDIIVAAESAYFLQAFRRIGLVPDGGSTYMLPRMIGKARAMEMTLLGEKVPAKTALEWGLINRCVPDDTLMDTALAFARELANGPAALGRIRKLMWASMDNSWTEQLHEERLKQSWAGKSADFAEGVAAFLQKRPAKFTGK